MNIDFACRVEIGRRETNDDRALICNQILDMTAQAGEGMAPVLAVVCDGCGGYAGGGTAAQTVLETLSSQPTAALTDPDALAAALEQCRWAVTRRKQSDPRLFQMCTTVAGCLFDERRILIFHAGDSRVYRYDGRRLARMTTDHSHVQAMVDLGRLTVEEARVSPSRNIITRCIGTDCPSPDIFVSSAPVGAGEIYLICSDGLWEYLSDADISTILSGRAPLDEKAAQLVELALSHGSDDNITACLCAGQGETVYMEETPFILD